MQNKDPQYYVQGVLGGSRLILARTITLLESSLPAHQQMAREICRQLLPHAGGAIRLGITGVPGVGKSTFVEALGMLLVQSGLRVAVLAVDPSSTRSGGSVMADKTRMEKLAARAEAFIRPSPAGKTTGGVARKTRESLMVCEAAGYDVVVVETVGVGQSETAVAAMVDFFLVLMLAGAGDELQGIKKGVLELADTVAVNKADGDNLPKARQACKIYQTALHLLSPASPNWTPPVLTCSAMENSGIDEIWQTVASHREIFTRSGELAAKRQSQALEWMRTLVEEGLRERFFDHPAVRERLPHISRQVEQGTLAPQHAAQQLLFSLDN